MLRTFSSKPAYSVRYWKKKNLLPRSVNVIEVIERRVERLGMTSTPTVAGRSTIHAGDARYARSYAHVPSDINLVITSPAYYGMSTYVSDQWLRNWFLGNAPEVPYDVGSQLSQGSPDAFAQSLAKVWNKVGSHLATDAKMYVRFGALPSRLQDPNRLMRKSLELSDHTWRITRVKRADSSSNGKRQARQMGTKSLAIEEKDFEIAFAA
jgi:hypothetical protein